MDIAYTRSPSPKADRAAVSGLPRWRLYALRAGYLLLVLGLGSVVWPGILLGHVPWTPAQGVVHCMLAAMSALALIGLRYPLAMLPLLFFELAWKTIWLLVVAAPLWAAHRMDAGTLETVNECLLAVVFVVVIPWRHVWAHYVVERGDRW